MTDDGARDERPAPQPTAAGTKRDPRLQEAMDQISDLPEDLRAELQQDVEALEQVNLADVGPGARDLRPFWRWVVFIAGLSLSLFHLYTGEFGIRPSLQQGSFHLGLGLALIFLLYPSRSDVSHKRNLIAWALCGLGFVAILLAVQADALTGILALTAAAVLVLILAARHLSWNIGGVAIADIILAAAALASCGYIYLMGRAMADRAGAFNDVDLLAGAVIMLLVLVATQRVIGTPLVVVAIGALLFAYFGQQMPGFLIHRGFSIERTISVLGLTTEGIFGTPIQISSRFIFLFMIFAAMLQRTGMERFFTQVAFGLTGGMIGGTAKVGVLTSAFSGTITGSSVANTVSNGAFTIPMMKKSGYKGEFAGAVEAASSTGGQLAPPIMGAAAFIMIDFIEVSYLEIITAAAIPAILFFTAQFIVIHYESKRLGIMGLPRDRLPNVRQLLLRKGYLIIPIVVIFVILAQGRSVNRAALYAIYTTIVVNVLVQLIMAARGRLGQMEDRLTVRALLDGLVDAARIALPIIAACAAAGMIAGVITMTGVGLQLTQGLLNLAGQTLLLTMVFSMVACLVLGIGLPTTANYVITATLVAPALAFFDPVPVIAAHFFVYYFGIMADITPPVCLASYAASGIAQSNPLKTGVQSVRIALGGFLLPYMFVLSPQLLLQEATWFTGTKAAITALVGVYAVGTAVVGFIDRRLQWWARLVLIGAGLLLLRAELATDLIGLAVFAVVFFWQWWTGPRHRRRTETAAAAPA
jgi:TRAP transporter 4TM/12TM fusion protein